MAKRRKSNAKALKHALTRANPHFLVAALMVFQVTAMLLLAFKTDTVDWQAIAFAVAMPLVSQLVLRIFVRLWPVDRTLMVLILFLCSVSLVTLKDIARSPVTPGEQGVFMLLGFVVMGFGIAVARLNIDWRKGCVALMCLAVPVILSPFVPGLGNRQYGALNWIQVSLGGFSVTAQPSEFVKPMLVICLAAMLGNHPGIKRAILALAFAAGLCGVLLIQSDLGALLIYFLTTVAMFYVATSRLGLSLAGLGAGAACAVIAYKTMPYVQRRLQSFLDPWSDPMETGYQIVQALIAIGSGGLFGMGLGLGMPRNIPLYHSDFIFAAICEEFGLIFAVCLLIVYALIFMRALTIAMNARTSFHSLVAFGIAFMFALQALIIVGGNIRLIPLTGVTLPLVSAGGSSIVGTMASLGLLIGISSLNAEAEAVDLRRMEWREGGGL